MACNLSMWIGIRVPGTTVSTELSWGFLELSIFTVYPGRLQKYPPDPSCTRNIGDGECVAFKDKVVVHSSN